MRSRVRIFAVCSSHDAFAHVVDGATALRERIGVPVVLQPASSVRDLAKDVTGEGRAIAATDLPSPPRPRAGSRARSRRRMTSLRLLRNERPDLPVVTVVERRSPLRAATLRRLGIREVRLPGEEDPPHAVAVVLAKEVLPQFAAGFLRTVPDRLRPGHRLALARGVMRPEATWGEAELARWTGVDVDRLRADFRRAAAGSPGEWCLWAHLYQLAERVEREGEAPGAAARQLGVSDPAAFLEECRPLMGEDPTTVLTRGGANEVLRRLRRWRSRSGRRPRGTERVVGTRRSPDGAAAMPLPVPRLTDIEERPARLQELYQKFAEDVRRGAKAGGASDEDADDIAQEVFQKLLQAGAALRDREFSRAYFRRAGRNRAVDRARKATLREQVLSSPSIQARRRAQWAESDRERSSREEVVRNAIRRLPEPQRAVVRLCDLEGWRVREVAELLGTTEKSVEHRRARARRRIRTHLEP